MRIACLHTAESNVPIFASAGADDAGEIALRHEVRDDLLRAAEVAGGLTDEIRAETSRALTALAAEHDAVLLTCSTLGPAADDLAATAARPILRVDTALADATARAGGTALVLCTVETTLGPTAELFARCAPTVQSEVELVPAAWDRFRDGDANGYLDAIARHADQGSQRGFTTVALAQASMAPAAERCRSASPLTSPGIGVRAAVAAARTR